jgi:hypothetical protein
MIDVKTATVSKRKVLAGLLAGSLVLIAVSTTTSRADTGSEQTDASPAPAVVTDEPARRHPREKTFMKRQWGVEVQFVRQTAAGYMLEFRYKVLDAEKAAALFERQTKPLLTHAETGAKLIVPTPAKTGALRNSNPPKAGNTYWMFFANPGKLVQPGDTVSIEIGDFLVKDLVVQ